MGRRKHGVITSNPLKSRAQLEPGWEEYALQAANADDVDRLAKLVQLAGRLPTSGPITALHVAASSGSIKVVNWILDQTYLLNIEQELSFEDGENGWTPLHRAVYFGQIAIVARLLEAGAPTTTLDNEGLSPIDIATSHLNEAQASELRRGTDEASNEGADDGDDDNDGVEEGWGLKPREKIKRDELLVEYIHQPQIYGWGSGRNFTLGTRDNGHKSRPVRVPNIVNNGNAMVIVDISTSSYHTMFLTKCNKVFVCGFGRGFRLGVGNEETFIDPVLITKLQSNKCVCIAAARDHSAATTITGELFTWGSNEHGQLGNDSGLSPFPTRVRFAKPIHAHGVAAGDCHTVVWGAIKRTHSVWVCGANKGQLGLCRNDGSFSTSHKWQQLSFFNSDSRKVQAVSTSSKLTLCLMAGTHEVFVLKDFTCVKLQSLASVFPRTMSVHRSCLSPRVVKVACTDDVFCCLSDSGRLHVSVDSKLIPIEWEVDRRSIVVVDFCIGKTETATKIIMFFVNRDGIVYRAAVKLASNQPRLRVRPTRVSNISQATHIWCGVSADHVLSLRLPRDIFRADLTQANRLAEQLGNPSCDDDADADDNTDQNKRLHTIVDLDANPHAKTDVITMASGEASASLHQGDLLRSPVLGANFHSRWGTKKQLAIELPICFDQHSDATQKALIVLKDYFKTSAFDDPNQDMCITICVEVLYLADALLLPQLKLLCELAIVRKMDISSLPTIFGIALTVTATFLVDHCAEMVVNNLETLLESHQLFLLNDAALAVVTNKYKGTFSQSREYHINTMLNSNTFKHLHHDGRFYDTIPDVKKPQRRRLRLRSRTHTTSVSSEGSGTSTESGSELSESGTENDSFLQSAPEALSAVLTVKTPPKLAIKINTTPSSAGPTTAKSPGAIPQPRRTSSHARTTLEPTQPPPSTRQHIEKSTPIAIVSNSRTISTWGPSLAEVSSSPLTPNSLSPRGLKQQGWATTPPPSNSHSISTAVSPRINLDYMEPSRNPPTFKIERKLSQKERRRAQNQQRAEALHTKTPIQSPPTRSPGVAWSTPTKLTTSTTEAMSTEPSAKPIAKAKPKSFFALIAEDEAKLRSNTHTFEQDCTPLSESSHSARSWGKLPVRSDNRNDKRAIPIRTTGPCQTGLAPPTTSRKTNFLSIVNEQKISNQVNSRNSKKSLAAIQMEEKALEEIMSVYDMSEEYIESVTLISTAK
eukprot:m.133745 g.133745  ORF g.133745 m.133745 type:complete len:1210 (-) comp29693_c2_seq2:173-3802(-)